MRQIPRESTQIFPICLTKFVKVGNEVVTNPCATISGKTNLLLHLYSGLILLMLKLACVFEKHLCIVLCPPQEASSLERGKLVNENKNEISRY